MTSITEINLSRGLPSGTTDQVMDVLRRLNRPVSVAELIDSGVISKSRAQQAIDLLMIRHEVQSILIGSALTSFHKRYYAVKS